MDGELPIFVDEPADYEPQGDYIVSKWKGRRFIMPIAVAQKAVARLNRALDQSIEGRGIIVPLRARH